MKKILPALLNIRIFVITVTEREEGEDGHIQAKGITIFLERGSGIGRVIIKISWMNFLDLY